MCASTQITDEFEVMKDHLIYRINAAWVPAIVLLFLSILSELLIFQSFEQDPYFLIFLFLEFVITLPIFYGCSIPFFFCYWQSRLTLKNFPPISVLSMVTYVSVIFYPSYSLENVSIGVTYSHIGSLISFSFIGLWLALKQQHKAVNHCT
tara:strand:- start:5 stop:454 length:450 start_codon:yes stop_codon:yes gene_type:complete